MSDGQTILISGGTGSFGRAMTEFLLAKTSYRVRIFSRDEAKHEDMARLFPPTERLTYIIGDVRDYEQLRHSMDGVWAVIHAAALKRVWAGQQHADEFTKTNVDGSRNVVNAAIDAGVRRSILISSDKAVLAINAYGKSKACAEELFIHANKKGSSRGCTFAVVRGGNVWGSRGSVATVWRSAGRPVLTDLAATRFNLCMPAWTMFVYLALGSMWGGEIFTPIAPAWALADLARAFNGVVTADAPRLGDKPHETLVSADEAVRTVVTDWAHVIEPAEALRSVWKYEPWAGGRLAGAYSSDMARRMSMTELRDLWATS